MNERMNNYIEKGDDDSRIRIMIIIIIIIVVIIIIIIIKEHLRATATKNNKKCPQLQRSCHLVITFIVLDYQHPPSLSRHGSAELSQSKHSWRKPNARSLLFGEVAGFDYD